MFQKCLHFKLVIQSGKTDLRMSPPFVINCAKYNTTVQLCHTVVGVILVNMEISVILGHEKTKIRNIIDYGKIDVFSVRTNIHIKNKMMGHLI